MRLYILYFLLFIFSNSSILSQINDSIQIKNDSIFNYTTKQTKGFFSKPIVKSLITPTLLIGYGTSASKIGLLKQVDYNIKDKLQKNYPYFSTHIDDYLQYTPAIAVYGLNAAGIHGKNNFWDRTSIYGLSIVLYTTADVILKNITHVQRPDGTSFTSFPSGHTTTAFAAAEFLHQEYKYKSIWYSIAGYTIATTTGILRMYNNKHWLSDVVAGAGIGILATKAAYWIYPFIKRKIFKFKFKSKSYL